MNYITCYDDVDAISCIQRNEIVFMIHANLDNTLLEQITILKSYIPDVLFNIIAEYCCTCNVFAIIPSIIKCPIIIL